MTYIIIGIVVIISFIVILKLFSNDSVDGESRIENDAKRFAKLLVSEIKLYETRKVQKGLETNNLYEILQNEIENARKLYKKRILNSDFMKYFDDSLVDILADGDKEKMGPSFNKSNF